MRFAILAVFCLMMVGCMGSYRALPPDQQHVQAVHDVDMPKEKLFSMLQLWFAENLGKSKEALQIQDKEAGLISGHIVIPSGISMGFVSQDLYMLVRVEIKDKKYRISFEDYMFWVEGHTGREAAPGGEHDSAKETARKVDAQILAYVTSKSQAKDW